MNYVFVVLPKCQRDDSRVIKHKFLAYKWNVKVNIKTRVLESNSKFSSCRLQSYKPQATKTTKIIEH